MLGSGVVAFMMLLAPAAAQTHRHDVATAVGVLRDVRPYGVTWRYSQHLDMNGDGERDEVFTSQNRTRFYVAVVLGPISRTSRVSVVSFDRVGNSQETLCGSFEALQPEKLGVREELRRAVGDELSGYPSGTAASGLRLVAGECDDFHLFWDTSANALNWWRL